MEAHDLTLAEAARAVGLHVETLRRLARAGQIETYVVNPGSRRPHFRVTPAALQAFRTRGRRTTDTDKSDAPALDDVESPGFLGNPPSQALSGAEMIARWERAGVFDAFAYLNDLVGPGKKYKDSTEYAQAVREQAQKRTDE